MSKPNVEYCFKCDYFQMQEHFKQHMFYCYRASHDNQTGYFARVGNRDAYKPIEKGMEKKDGFIEALELEYGFFLHNLSKERMHKLNREWNIPSKCPYRLEHLIGEQ